MLIILVSNFYSYCDDGLLINDFFFFQTAFTYHCGNTAGVYRRFYTSASRRSKAKPRLDASLYTNTAIIHRPAIFIYFPLFNKLELTLMRCSGAIYIGRLIFITNMFADFICFRLCTHSADRVSCRVVSAEICKRVSFFKTK